MAFFGGGIDPAAKTAPQLGTWIYMFRWGWMVACDAIPVVTVAVLYMTAPWDSHKLSIVEMAATTSRPRNPAASRDNARSS